MIYEINDLIINPAKIEQIARVEKNYPLKIRLGGDERISEPNGFKFMFTYLGKDYAFFSKKENEVQEKRDQLIKVWSNSLKK